MEDDLQGGSRKVRKSRQEKMSVARARNNESLTGVLEDGRGDGRMADRSKGNGEQHHSSPWGGRRAGCHFHLAPTALCL